MWWGRTAVKTELLFKMRKHRLKFLRGGWGQSLEFAITLVRTSKSSMVKDPLNCRWSAQLCSSLQASLAILFGIMHLLRERPKLLEKKIWKCAWYCPRDILETPHQALQWHCDPHKQSRSHYRQANHEHGNRTRIWSRNKWHKWEQILWYIHTIGPVFSLDIRQDNFWRRVCRAQYLD